MFWDKKEKGLPDLPPMPFVPPTARSVNPGLRAMEAERTEHGEDAESPDLEKHNLPAFPDSPMQRGFSQSAIKDAVAHENTEETSVVQSLPASTATMKTVEVDEWSSHPLPQPPSQPLMVEAPMRQQSSLPATVQMPQLSSARPQRAPKNTEIFVKIDKFYSAKRALDAANEKLEEIDVLLHKIREMKMREEQELSSWEKDLATIKARMKEVTETIFEKVE